MPFHLFLLRHAETEPQQSGQSDFDRKLLPKGIDQIGHLAQNLTGIQFHLDSIICSTAIRAKTTAINLMNALNISSDTIHFDQTIYTAEHHELLEIIQQTDDRYSHLLVVGHNPTLSNLATYLTKGFADGLRTCEMVSIEFGMEHWSDLQKGTGKLKGIIQGAPSKNSNE